MPQVSPLMFDTRNWPNVRDPNNITEADHAAHRSPKGIPYPQDLGMSAKAHKGLMKLAKFAKHPVKAHTPKKKKVV